MKTLWDFIIKHEFWCSFLVIIGLHFGEYKTGDGWMGGWSRKSSIPHCNNASRISSDVEEG
jgi:hypothetical protein